MSLDKDSSLGKVCGFMYSKMELRRQILMFTCCHDIQAQGDVVFSIWDMAGQEVYYATHQCFLSRNTLYLVVWNMEEGEKGIDFLRPWLLNIQVSSLPPHPGGPVPSLPPAQEGLFLLTDFLWYSLVCSSLCYRRVPLTLR